MKIFLSVIFSLAVLMVNAQITIKPYVDERMELLSVVFRLAEVEEYSTRDNLPYLEKVEQWFAPYKEHKVVVYTKLLRQNQEVAFSAVPDLAVRLKKSKGKFSIDKKFIISDLDERWNRDSLPRYIKLLNDFYNDSKFEKFFKANTQYYTQVESRFKTLVSDMVNYQWFCDFFGKNNLNFESRIIISLLNGRNNYGASTKLHNGKEIIYSINGCGNIDSLGLPWFSPQFAGVVVHEFCHNFCNPMIDKYFDQMQSNAEKFFEPYRYEMSKQHYGTVQHYLSEIFVRASTILYKVSQTDDQEEQKDIRWSELQNEKSNGFLWIDSLYDHLVKYNNNRLIYKKIEDFMPEIVKLQNRLNPEEIYQTYENRRATILGTNIENGSNSVDYRLDSIVVSFSLPMMLGNNGASPDFRCKECNSRIPYKEGKKHYWSKDQKQWTIFVKLEPDTEYGIVFPSNFFRTHYRNSDGYWELYRPKNSYYLRFKTKK